MKLEILLAMLFMHIVGDFNLQGILAQFKQKSYWKVNAPEEMYKKDYIAALGIHGFSWAFVVILPLYLFGNLHGVWLCASILLMGVTHAIVDHAKANQKKINLLQDQLVHVCQIVLL